MDEELKEELDAFVLAVLAEYAKLFLQPGADVSKCNLALCRPCTHRQNGRGSCAVVWTKRIKNTNASR